MALFKTTVTRVTGRGAHLFAETGDRLLNNAGIYNLGEEEDGCSSFEYYINLVDDRDGVVRIETDDPYGIIVAYADMDYAGTFIDLYIYPERNKEAATEKTTVLTKNISIAYDVDGGSVIHILQGSVLTRELCSNTVSEILSGATTTTTLAPTTTTTLAPTTTTTLAPTTTTTLAPTTTTAEPTTTTTSSTTTTSYTTSSTTTTSHTTTSTTTTTAEVPLEGELWDDGVDYFRLQARGGDQLYLDQAITGLGFDGVEDIDWGNIWSKSLP